MGRLKGVNSAQRVDREGKMGLMPGNADSC